MVSDVWADPIEQMSATFSKEGLRQACFQRDLAVHGDRRQLAARLVEAGYYTSDLTTGRR